MQKIRIAGPANQIMLKIQALLGPDSSKKLKERLNRKLLRTTKLEKVKKLLESGADVNATNKNGWTALMLAAGKGHTETAMFLLKQGADVNARDKDGMTPLIWAAIGNRDQACSSLLDAGANINDADKEGWTALMRVAQRSNASLCKTFLSRGADPNAVTEGGQTALMISMKMDYPFLSSTKTRDNDGLGICVIFMKYGADTCARDKAHNTARAFAINSGLGKSALLLSFMEIQDKESGKNFGLLFGECVSS